MSTLRTLKEDFNRHVGEVESLKTEIRKKAHKVPLLEVWGCDGEKVMDLVVTVYATCKLCGSFMD